MEKFERLVTRCVLLREDDIDTDIIFPARFLLITEKKGLGRYAFYERRNHADGRMSEDNGLGQGAGILIAGRNFGCGSSREQAVWALHDLGIRCIIAPSFGEIFYGNCFPNGILPIVLDAVQMARVQADAGQELTVDLAERRIVRPDGSVIAFDIADSRRTPLLHGWDEVDTILGSRLADIAAFEQRQQQTQPWLWQPIEKERQEHHG